jgi:hypothetical protein
LRCGRGDDLHPVDICNYDRASELMSKDKHLIEEPFGQVRFILKSLLIFVAILGGLDVLSSYSDKLKFWQDDIRKNTYALPFVFVLFLAVHLVYEVVLRTMRRKLEALRSDPVEPRRRAEVKARRQQRIKTRR